MNAFYMLGEAVSPTLQEVFKTGLTTVQSDVMGYIADALPIGLVIMGVFLAIKLGIKFFRTVAK